MKFRLLVSEAQLLGQFDENRSGFLKKVFDHADKKSKWTYVSPEELGPKIGEPMERIGIALDYLADKELIELQPGQARKQYRILQQPQSLPGLIQQMQQSFRDKELRDQGRVQQIFQFIAQNQCKANYLLDYFGEAHSKNCGHCAPCLGEGQASFTPHKALPLNAAQRQRVAELKALHLPELSSPRKLARYLTGINSPASSPVRKAHPKLFGALEGASFQAILEGAG